MIPLVVVTHPDRLTRARELLAATGGQALVIDPGNRGCVSTHLDAYRVLHSVALTAPGVQWVCALEDDAVPVPGFTDQLAQVAAATPSPITSLYLGRGRPVHWQSSIAQVIAPVDADPHFLLGSSMLHTVGLLIAVEWLERLIDWMEQSFRHYPGCVELDGLWSYFLQEMALTAAYTRPSLVDHDDEIPSVIPVSAREDGEERTEKRVAWLADARESWEMTTAVIPTPTLLFHGR